MKVTTGDSNQRDALLAAIVETSDDAIISKDLDGTILTWNKAASRIFGYAPEEILGENIRRLIPEELQHEEDAILAKICSGDRVSNYETTRIRKGGERFEVSITVSPLADPTGKVIGASKIAREITERKRFEKQIIQSEKLAATARLAATVAHEINNPLTSVLNLLYMARVSDSISEARSYVITAETELERVSQIARQALGFYRDDGTPSPVQLGLLVDRVLAVYQGKIRSADITVDRRTVEHPRLIASQGELMQVLANLVVNAIDAMPQGGILKIDMRRRISPNGMEIVVSDTGHGIKIDHLPHVFEPFFTTKGSVGTGIGLWIVKQLIERQRGTVEISSQTQSSDSGTTVTIFLPLSESVDMGAGALN